MMLVLGSIFPSLSLYVFKKCVFNYYIFANLCTFENVRNSGGQEVL